MTGREDLFEESMELGHSAAWDQDWERAIEFYRKAVAEFPDHGDALTSLGLALLETGREKEALAIYRQAAKASPDDPVPLEKCAEIFEQLGQQKEAIEQREAAAERYMRRRDAEKAVDNWTHIGRLTPTNMAARSRLALTNERLGRRRQAVHEYLAVASILQKAGRIDRATEAVQRALSLIPGDTEAAQLMRSLRHGEALPPPAPPLGATRPLRMSQVKAILESPLDEGFLSRDGDGPGLAVGEGVELSDPEVAAQQQSLSLLAGLLFDEPGSEAGEEGSGPDFESLTKGISSGRGESVAQPVMYRYLSQAIDLQTRERKKEAAKELQRAIDAGIDHPAAHYNLGFLYKELGQHDEARSHFMESVGHPDLALGANLALGRIARAGGDMSEASRHLLQALRLVDSLSADEQKSGELGQLYDSIQATQSRGDEEALTAIVENTLEFLSGPDWLSKLKSARQQLGGAQTDDSSVVSVAQMLSVGGSDRVLTSMSRIEALMKEGFHMAAMEEAMLALQYAPTYLALHQRMAEIIIMNGRLEAGINKLKIVAETHRIRGEIPEAANTYQLLLRHAPVDVGARNSLIELLHQQDNLKAALAQSVELADIYRQMAQLDQARRTLAEAFEHAERSNADKASMLEILREMGDIDAARLDWRQSLQVWQKVLNIDPRNQEAQSKIIDLNLRLGKEDQAAKTLDKYLESLVKEGRGPEALEILEELAREYPGKQILHARLAEAYRAAGRKADAIAQYDALGELQLDAGQTKDAIKTIETIIGLEPPDLEGYEELVRNLKSSA